MLMFSVQKVKSYIKGGINYNTQFDNDIQGMLLENKKKYSFDFHWTSKRKWVEDDGNYTASGWATFHIRWLR
jgi:hypothetical protein